MVSVPNISKGSYSGPVDGEPGVVEPLATLFREPFSAINGSDTRACFP